VGLLGSVNDSRVLNRFAHYRNAQYHGIFEFNNASSQHCLTPYLLGDKGYPLITWTMTLSKEEGQHTILELLYTRK